MKETVTMGSVIREADTRFIDTRAEAAAIMCRMEERAAALRLLAGADPEGDSYVVERETGSGFVVFTVSERVTGELYGRASAGGVGVSWWVTADPVEAEAPVCAVAGAVCLLLAASVAAERSAGGG